MYKIALINTGPNPMGLVYLGSWIKNKIPNLSIDILQADYLEKILKNQNKNKNIDLLINKYDIFGLSAMTLWYEQACEIGKLLKQKIKEKSEEKGNEKKVILGGVHISICPGSSRGIFDKEFLGESEYNLTNYLLNQPEIDKMINLEDYPDLDLNLYPSDTWKLRLTRATMKHNIVGTLLTSRGCPFKCRFCSTTQFYEKYRVHTPEWTIRQVENLAAKGCDYLAIWDDLFTANKKRVAKIADLWEKSGVGKQIRTVCLQGRADVTDDEICEHLKRMNVKSIGFGFESGNNRVIKYLKQYKASVELNNKAIDTCKKHNIKPFGFVMLGNPTETFKEMLDTVKWVFCNSFKIDDIITYAPAPYPGTEFWQIAKNKGLVSDKMNFNNIVIHSKIPYNAIMYDIPKYQYFIAWFLLQIATLPYKFRKFFNIVKNILLKK